jgi:hypothetical protein
VITRNLPYSQYRHDAKVTQKILQGELPGFWSQESSELNGGSEFDTARQIVDQRQSAPMPRPSSGELTEWPVEGDPRSDGFLASLFWPVLEKCWSKYPSRRPRITEILEGSLFRETELGRHVKLGGNTAYHAEMIGNLTGSVEKAEERPSALGRTTYIWR